MILDPIEIYNLKRNPLHAHKFEKHTFEILEYALPLMDLSVPIDSLDSCIDLTYFISKFVHLYCQVLSFRRFISLYGLEDPLFSIICKRLLFRNLNDFYYLRGKREFFNEDFTSVQLRRILEATCNALEAQWSSPFANDIFLACKELEYITFQCIKVPVKIISFDSVLFLRSPP